MNYEFLKQLPKVELHCHLDGSLRLETLFELMNGEFRIANSNLNVKTIEDLRKIVVIEDRMNSLEEFLAIFPITLSVMQDAESIRRIAYELAEDNAKENVRYLEVRFSPILHTEKDLTMEDALRAVIDGLQQAESDFPIKTGVIVCGIRNMTPEISKQIADLAIQYDDCGVVGFDLAGAEYDNPAKKHKEAFYRVINANMNVTIHAGESYGPESIHQAIHYCSANRIGHGTRLFEDSKLMEYVNDHRIPLEVCLTSNYQTGGINSISEHPIKKYLDAGLRVTLNTDNRLICDTTMTKEYQLAVEHLGFTLEDLRLMMSFGIRSAFLHRNQRVELLKGCKEIWNKVVKT